MTDDLESYIDNPDHEPDLDGYVAAPSYSALKGQPMPVYRNGPDAFNRQDGDQIALTYAVPDLLERLRANRANHEKQYAEAMEGFRAQVIAKCEERLRQAKDHISEATQSIPLLEPENHLAEYDTVIEMLEITKDEEMILDYSQFQRLVRDNWEWKGRFTALYAGYSQG